MQKSGVRVPFNFDLCSKPGLLAAGFATLANHNLLRKENKDYELSWEYFHKSFQKFQCQKDSETQ